MSIRDSIDFHVVRHRLVASIWILCLLVLLAGCNEAPGYLDKSEQDLGLFKSPLGTDHRVFHSALLYPYGLGLRSTGYIVGVEKGNQALVGGPAVHPEVLAEPAQPTTAEFDGIRSRLEGDRKAQLITHVVRYKAIVDDGRGGGADGEMPAGTRARITQCVLYSALQPPPDHMADQDEGRALFRPCRNGADQPTVAADPDSVPGAYAASWQAVDRLRAALTEDLRTGRYTDIIVVVMGWNTAESEALQNINSFAGHLLDEAEERAPAGSHQFSPLLVGVTWPSLWELNDWAIVPTAVVRGVSFPYKADDANEFASTWLREVVTRAIVPARDAAAQEMGAAAGNRDQPRVVLVGHSFGARAVLTALVQAPQLEPPSSSVERLLGPQDRVILLQGAMQIERLFDEDGNLPQPFSAGDPRITMTASQFDTAVSTAFWGQYLGDIDTFDGACHEADASGRWRGLDVGKIGCGVATRVEKPAYGFSLCQKTERSEGIDTLDGKSVRYFDATAMINCNAPFTGGGAHSDIYRRETARFLLDEMR